MVIESHVVCLNFDGCIGRDGDPDSPSLLVETVVVASPCMFMRLQCT